MILDVIVNSSVNIPHKIRGSVKYNSTHLYDFLRVYSHCNTLYLALICAILLILLYLLP